MPKDISKASELTDLKEIALFLEKNKGKILMPRKFLIAVKSMIVQRVPEMYRNNPNTSITEVVALILNGLDKRTDGDMLLKITKWIVQEWLSLS